MDRCQTYGNQISDITVRVLTSSAVDRRFGRVLASSAVDRRFGRVLASSAVDRRFGRVLASSAVDRGFGSWLGQTKEYEIGFSFFANISTQH